ncbi:MAG: sodium:proline symporter [Halofilum sp. (in: g-proteobacteria)]|nr:sodium:proline symporter [Halofilum sp. (in: g-proteobacteria)]
MDLGTNAPILIGVLVAIAVVSVAITPRVRTADGFFRGWAETGTAPGVLTLTLSQVTTWIFARSLLNAGILGYYFGISGALAYTAYYGSFLTGWLIVDHLRFSHGVDNVQAFLAHRFGRWGSVCFNLLVSLRLVSEVFANLLVVGIVFGMAGSTAHVAAILAVASVTLGYSMTGGLRASLRTDVLQMGILVVLLAALVGLMLVNPLFDPAAIVASSWAAGGGPGWILLLVAALQVWSYPLHDPVMMDRGFIADRDTTRRSFLHAFWISALCILAFGVLGVFAGLHRQGGEELLATLARLLGGPATLMLGAALVISAASTLDSTFSSAAKLVVRDMGLAEGSADNGRVAMALFAALGLTLVFFGTDDLFAAVAVSGTASLFLTPVILFCIWGKREVARWAFAVAVVAALAGAVIYFMENAGYIALVEPLTGLEHKYSRLLAISVAVLAIGLGSFAAALRPRRPEEATPTS